MAIPSCCTDNAMFYSLEKQNTFFNEENRKNHENLPLRRFISLHYFDKSLSGNHELSKNRNALYIGIRSRLESHHVTTGCQIPGIP